MKRLICNKWSLILPILFLLSSCATIMGGGSTQDIEVQTVDIKSHKPIEGTTCTITDSKGHRYIVQENSNKAVVTRGQGALTVKCLKQGFQQANVASGSGLNAWLIGDVLFWPGAIVDAVSGSAEKYPDKLIVAMKPIAHHIG